MVEEVVVENYASRTNSEDARRISSEVNGAIGGLADRASEAAKNLGAQVSEEFDDLKSVGRGMADECTSKVARGKRQIRETAGRISEYADNNTGLVVGGALAFGILVGFVLARRSE